MIDDMLKMMAVLLVSNCAFPVWAQTDQPKTKVVKVSIELKDDAGGGQVRGSLYRFTQASSSRTLVANIDINGVPLPPIECEPSERFLAEPADPMIYGDRTPQFCRETLAFQYKRFRIRGATIVSVSLAAGVAAASASDWGAAHANFTEAHAKVTARKANEPAAIIAQEAAIAAAALAMGDTRLDKFVTRDPYQKYGLVLTDEGEIQLKTIQREAKIDPTGKLDFKTRSALKKLGRTSADPGELNAQLFKEIRK